MQHPITIPFDQAKEIANIIACDIVVYCTRVLIAGQVRRQEKNISTIDILLSFEKQKALSSPDIFQTRKEDSLKERIKTARARGSEDLLIREQKSENEFILSNGIQLNLIPVATTAFGYWSIIYTGPKEYIVNIVTQARKKAGINIEKTGAELFRDNQLLYLENEAIAYQYLQIKHEYPTQRK